ncbi:MAG: Glutathione transport system permease protein GsiD [Candidatus Heimdallarchaeota archaeon LC_2]|nr:MAG: Glutathione transport system permease protein GsiD [Candidatus Heimdallarchaeota archaeon LC_2]
MASQTKTHEVTKDQIIIDVEDKVAEIKGINQWSIIISRIRNNKAAVIALYYVMLNLLIAFFYPLFLSETPVSTDPGKNRRFGGGVNAFPNLKYPAGVNIQGYDLYSRMVAGTETSIIVGVVATLISLVIGVIVGLLAGYYQGKLEEIAMRITDLFLAVPFLIIALIMIRMVNGGQTEIFEDFTQLQIIILLLGVFGWAGLARLVTANVKQVSALEYIDAVRIMGASDKRIIVVHILPNVLAPIIVITSIFIAGAILSEAALAFLGFGDPVNTVSWGIEVSQAQDSLQLNPEQALIPGFAIFFLVLAVNIFGDAIRDALDPRLKD